MTLSKIKYRRRARKRLPHLDREDANLLGDFTDVVNRDFRRMVWRDRFSGRNLAGLAVVLAPLVVLAGYVYVQGMPR